MGFSLGFSGGLSCGCGIGAWMLGTLPAPRCPPGRALALGLVGRTCQCASLTRQESTRGHHPRSPCAPHPPRLDLCLHAAHPRPPASKSQYQIYTISADVFPPVGPWSFSAHSSFVISHALPRINHPSRPAAHGRLRHASLSPLPGDFAIESLIWPSLPFGAGDGLCET